MKTSRTIIQSLFITMLVCLPIFAQVQSQKVTHFSKNGLNFDYPAGLKVEDLSNESAQHLVMVQNAGGAQIMVISRYDKITSAEQLATARRTVADAFTDKMWEELQKMDPKVTRVPAQIEIAGAQATGFKLRAVLNNEPGNAEVYSLLLGKRLVLVTLIGSDKELASSASDWSTIRRSLKIDESAAPAQGAAQPAPAGALAQPDTGTVTGQTYSNRYFDLALTIPQGWQIHDARTKALIMDTGKKLLTSKDSNAQAGLDASLSNTLNLLTVTQFPFGSAVAFNPGFIIAAEKLPGEGPEVTSTNYLSEMKKVFQYSQVPVSVERDVHTEALGARSMAAIDIKFQSPNGTVKQRYYAYVKKGYALGFILSYQTPEQLQSITSLLGTLKLQ